MAITGDPIALTVRDSTALTGTNVDGNGWVADVTFKGMSLGQTGDGTKISFTATDPGFDSAGVATTVSRTVLGTAQMRLPTPSKWVTGTVYAAGARCTNVTKLYSTVAGGTSGATIPTHTSGTVSDGAVSWLYVGDTALGAFPPYLREEALSGSDAVVPFSLDQRVFANTVISNVSIGANAYGSSRASNASLMTITNSSTLTHLRPHFCWAVMPWSVVANTLHLEVTGTHPFGQSSRMVNCVIFTVSDGTHTVSSTVTSMTQSTTITGGNPVPVFAADINISSLTDGLIYASFKAYPFRGDVIYDSLVDGKGAAVPTVLSRMSVNPSKALCFSKDAAAALTTFYAYVDPGGASGSPAASSNPATAAINYFGTIDLARAAVKTAAGSGRTANCEIRLRAGTFSDGFGGTGMPTDNPGLGWLIISRDLTTAPNLGDVNITPSATANNKRGYRRTKYVGLKFTQSTGTAAVDNIETTGSVGDASFESWYESCQIVGVAASSQRVITRAGNQWYTNCTMTDVGTHGADGTRSGTQIIGGCTVTGTASLLAASGYMGNNLSGGANVTPASMVNCGEGTGISTPLDAPVFMANKWIGMSTVNSYPKFPQAGTILTSGLGWCQNLMESTGGKICEISADNNVTTVSNIHLIYNGGPGEGMNLCYNETGTARVVKDLISRFNYDEDVNMKSDAYTTASGSQALRTGNWITRYGVDFLGNVTFNASAAPPSPGPSGLAGEILPKRSTFGPVGSARGFTLDKSLTGTNLGNGDYRPTSSSPVVDRVASGEALLPFDLVGAARLNDGHGACGPYERI